MFETLNKISKKDRKYFQNLSEQEKKEFAPVVIMRWLAGIKDPAQIFFLNELVNPFVFDLYYHKDLLYKLMTICTDGSGHRYTWMKAKGKSISMPSTVKLVKMHYSYSTTEAQSALEILNEADVLELAEAYALDKDEIAKIKTEYKKQK